MTDSRQASPPAPDEQAVHGDLIRTEIGEQAQHVAAGKNILQIIVDNLHLPLWLLYSMAASIFIVVVSVGWFGYLSLFPGIPVVLPPTPTATLTPIPSATPSSTPTSLPFAPEAEGEVLIVIATFDQVEKVEGNEPHDHIRLAIQAEAKALDFANLRVEVEPSILVANDRDEAEALGQRYNASLVIWGEENTMLVAVNFLNRKQPDAEAADVLIEEITQTLDSRQQIAAALVSIPPKPDPYNQFITRELPDQLTFLALFAVGQSYAQKDENEQAVQTIERALQRLNRTSLIAGAAAAYCNLGSLYQQLHNSSKTISNYSECLNLDPKNADAYNQRAQEYLILGKYRYALADYTEIIRFDLEHAGIAFIYGNRGTTYGGDLKQYNQALADLNYAIKLDPKFFLFYFSRGNVYYDMEQYEQALADYTESIRLLPIDFVYINRGNVYHERKQYELAIDDYTEAIRLKPNYVKAYHNRGNSYRQLGRYEQAIADYTKAIRLAPEDAGAHHNRGLAYAQQEMYEQAIADYTEAIRLDPENVSAYYDRGIGYYELRQYEQAIADYTEAIHLDPEYPSTYCNRGLAYAR